MDAEVGLLHCTPLALGGSPRRAPVIPQRRLSHETRLPSGGAARCGGLARLTPDLLSNPSPFLSSLRTSAYRYSAGRGPSL